jgi:hypothetical protein
MLGAWGRRHNPDTDSWLGLGDARRRDPKSNCADSAAPRRCIVYPQRLRFSFPAPRIHRLVAVAAFFIAASLSAQAEPAKESATAEPIPTLHCEFKAVNACSTDGTCKAGKDLNGMPLPLKVTVDFENTVVSALDETGFARTDNIDAVADSGDELIVHGIDGAFGWQIVIHNGSPAASITFASADSVITGFGTCTNK